MTEVEDEIDRGIDMQENDLQIGVDAEAERGITETGETTLMIEGETAARILLIRGPVAEEMQTIASLQSSRKTSQRCVQNS